MKTHAKLAFSGVLAAAAVAATGCRTIRSSDASYYPKPKAPAPVAEPAQEPVEVAVAPVSVAPVAAAPAAVSPEPAAAPAVPAGTVVSDYPREPVQDAASVGKPGTYREFVITDDGTDRSYAFESDGLQGQTGRHVSKPAPTPDPVSKPAPAPAGSGYYVVQDGDILGRIARKHGVSEKALLAANPSLKDPDKIRVGQKLAIPQGGKAAPEPGVRVAAQSAKKPAAASGAKKAPATLPEKPGHVVYVVKDGDILGRVARKYGTTAKAIMDANGISDDRKVRAGKPIYVPVSAMAEPAEPQARPVAAEPTAAESAAPATAPAAEPPVPSDPYLVL